MLDTAQTLESAVHHDDQSGAQSLTLLHTAKRNGQKKRDAMQEKCGIRQDLDKYMYVHVPATV